MWYKLDINRFGHQMLPPILRSPVLSAILSVLLLPLVDMYSRWVAFRAQQQLFLEGNGQALAMRMALVKRYRLREDDVAIVDAQERDVYLYRVHEDYLPTYLNAERGAYLHQLSQGRLEPDYTVLLPDFLELQDRDIRDLLERYRPAGRRYDIKYYSYE